MNLWKLSSFLLIVVGAAYLAVGALSKNEKDSKATATQKGGEEKKAGTNAGKGNAAKGQTVFESNCAICHKASSDTTKVGPGLKGLFKKHLHQLRGKEHVHSIETIRQQIKKGSGLMPPMETVLSEEQLDDLLAYLQTL